MEAQKFLKRYEQDQCEYCHLNSDGYIKALFLERNDYDDEDYINTIGIMGRLFIRSTPNLEGYKIGDIMDAEIKLFRKEYDGRRRAKFEVDLILEKKRDK